MNQEPGHRLCLEQAFGGFKRAGDVEGLFASCAWLLRSSTSVENARTWIMVAEDLAATHSKFDDPELEERVISRFQPAHHFRPHHPLVEHWASRAEHLARTLDGIGGRIRMAAFALAVHLAHGDIRRAGVTIAETESLARRSAAPRSDAILYLFWLGYYRLQTGDLSAAENVLNQMERLTASDSTLQDRAMVSHFGFRAMLYAGDLERARAYHGRLEPLADYLPPHSTHGGTKVVYLRLLERDIDAALAMAHAVCRAGPLYPMFQPMWRANLGQVLLEQGAAEAALAELDSAISAAQSVHLRASECTASLLRAAACFRLGRDDAAYASLSAGLAIARDLGCVPQQPFVLPPRFRSLRLARWNAASSASSS
jgi:tetratricopeptide (TPR) repeat protein